MSGLTLLEVLSTLSIGVILVTVAVPSMENVIANGRRASATTELLISMSLARSEAMKRRRHVTVCKSADGESCGLADVSWSDGWIVFVNDSSLTAGQRDAGEELLHVSPGLPQDTVLNPTAAVQDFISFRPSGRSAVTGLYTWCDDRGNHEARGVFVLPSGQTWVADETLDGDALSCAS